MTNFKSSITVIVFILLCFTTAVAQTASDCGRSNVLCVDDTSGATREYATIQAAATIAKPGDVVLVFPGTYSGFRAATSGSSNSPIIFKTSGVPGSAVISSAASTGDGIYLSKVNYITIDGFAIRNVPQRCIAAGDASSTTPMVGLTIQNNTCTASGNGGFYLSQVSRSLVQDNVIDNVAKTHGIYLANGGSDNTILRRNVIRSIRGTDSAGIHINGDLSIGGDGLISGVVLDGNMIYDISFNGVSLDGVQNTTLQNNLVFRTTRHAVRAFRIDGAQGPKNLRFVNNTFHTPSNGGWAIKITQDLGGHIIFNNVLLADNSSSGSIGVETTTGLKTANNAVGNRFTRDGENSTLTFSQWRALGFDANSFTTIAASLFVAPASNDYRLRSGSPAIDSGAATYSGITAPAYDRVNNARPAGVAYDIGALESTAGSPTTDTTPPTVSMTSPAGGSTVTGSGVTVSANASDNISVAGVQFQLDGVNVGTEDTTAPYSIAWNTTQTANGSHTLRAIARDSAANRTTSASVNVIVNNSAPPSTNTTTTISSNRNPAQSGTTITFSAQISPATAGGTVQFFDGSTVLTTVGVTNGQAAFSTASLSTGSHNMKAVYSGNASYNGSASAILTQTVTASTELSCIDRNVLCVGSGQEYSNIQSAANAAIPGDTVLVYPGTYAGFRIATSGNSNARITYKANGAAGSVVISSPMSTGDGIYLSKVSYVTVEGFQVQNMSQRCIAARDASATSPVSNVIIRNNICTGAGAEGIYVSQLSNSLIEGNTIHHLSPSSSRGHGIYLANAGSDNTTLRRNVIYAIQGSESAGIHMNGDVSIGGDGIISGVVLDGNMIYDINFNGVSMDGVQNAVFHNNLIFRTSRHAVRAFQIDGAQGPKNFRFVNNTIHTTSSGWAIRLSEDGGGHQIFNNILLAESSAAGSVSIGTTSGFDSSNNVVVNRFSRDSSSTISLAQWQSSGFDTNSFLGTAASLFVNAASNDYRLKTGALAINAGILSFNGTTAPTIDRVGTARPVGGAIDIGCYEQ